MKIRKENRKNTSASGNGSIVDWLSDYLIGKGKGNKPKEKIPVGTR